MMNFARPTLSQTCPLMSMPRTSAISAVNKYEFSSLSRFAAMQSSSCAAGNSCRGNHGTHRPRRKVYGSVPFVPRHTPSLSLMTYSGYHVRARASFGRWSG